MRINMPVTNVEVSLKDTSMIVSKTDLKGQITYVNRDFLDISGFTEQELIGTSHNIVRHPDMPVEAFADLWATLKSGRPWIGLVKNRCKNGDYYWVEAHATPLIENGQVTGYVSVRKKPSRSQVEQAEQIYRLFREKKAGNLKVEFGGVVKDGLVRKLNIFRGMTVKTRLYTMLSLVSLLLLIVGGMGLYGMNKSDDGLETVYKVRTVAVGQVTAINRLIQRNRIAASEMIMVPTPDVVAQRSGEIEQNAAAVSKLAEAYMSNIGSPQEKQLAEKFAADRAKFVNEGLKPVVAAAQAGHADEAKRLYLAKIEPLNAAVSASVEVLKEFELSAAKEEFAAAQARSATLRNLALGLIVLGVLLAAMMIVSVLRAIIGPLDTAVGVFAKMAEGHFSNAIDITKDDEPGRVMQSMQIMQTKLGFDVAEANRLSDENLRIKIALDNVSTGVMIADPGRTIIYANKSVQNILKTAEADIRKQLPNFSADKMMGINIDTFHKNPTHQAQLLNTFTTTYTANLEIGGRYLRVTASPVINERGERLGAVAEWLDRTGEVTVEQEVARIVDGAKNGDFEQRLKLEGKEGFFHHLAEGLNQLSQVTSTGLNDVARVLKSVAQGDLTQTVQAEYSGIFGQLKDDTNTTVGRLQEVLGQIRDASEAINTASQEIAAGNQDLSSRTEEQASSLEETSSSMEELNSTVKQNAENARQANELAKTSNEVATKGGEMVKRVVSTMSDIQGSSKKIADIIGVIDSIAFQTNILALNAAVEAARAGEQGRGFAVVATEVRNLAQRSATAAKEIKTLIAESVDKVEGGAKLVKEAGDTMDDVVTSFQKVANLVTDIADASRAQSSGIEQVTKAVGQMDEVTQQNAALVEEAAAAAESLEEQARALVQSVGMFKLSERIDSPLMTLKQAPAQRLAGPARSVMAQTKVKKLPPIHASNSEEEWAEF